MGRITGQLRSFAHKSPVASRPVPLDQAVANALAVLEGRLAESHATLQCPASSPCPVALCDGNRLEQVLINLIGNALKFTEHGEVRIEIALAEAQRSDAPGRLRLRIAVTDTGIGMTRDQIGQIFDPFTQADGSITRRYGGTGLGLTIVQRLVGLMGGDVSVESEPGLGSSFSFEIAVGVAG